MSGLPPSEERRDDGSSLLSCSVDVSVVMLRVTSVCVEACSVAGCDRLVSRRSPESLPDAPHPATSGGRRRRPLGRVGPRLAWWDMADGGGPKRCSRRWTIDPMLRLAVLVSSDEVRGDGLQERCTARCVRCPADGSTAAAWWACDERAAPGPPPRACPCVDGGGRRTGTTGLDPAVSNAMPAALQPLLSLSSPSLLLSALACL